MSTSIESVLKRLLEQEGPGLLEQSGRLKSFLHDECPEAKREISVLLLALDEHVPQDLMRVHSGEPMQSLGPRLAKRLSDEKAMDRNASDWAVRTWARGLGVGSEAALGAPGPLLEPSGGASDGPPVYLGKGGAQGSTEQGTQGGGTRRDRSGQGTVVPPVSRNYLVYGAVALAAVAGAWLAFFQPQFKITGVSTAEAMVGDGKKRDVFVEFKASQSPAQKILVRHVSGERAGNPETWTANVSAEASATGRTTVGQMAVRSSKPSTATYEYVLVAADGKRSEPYERTFEIAPAPTQPATITNLDLRAPQYVGRPFNATLGYQAGSSDVAQIELKVIESTGKWAQDLFTQNVTGTTGKSTGTVQYAFAPAKAPMRATVEFVLIGADGARSDPRRVAIDVVSPTAAMAAGQASGVVMSVRATSQQADTTGAGAVIGGIVGGVLGNQVGGGTGKTLATIAGAGGGAVVGNQIEKNSGGSKTWSITVKLDDGRTQVFSSGSAPSLRAGERVRIANGTVLPDR